MAPNLTGRGVRCVESITPHASFRTTSSLNLFKEEERLATFEDWPNAFMSPEDLAADGFYYTGRGDNVRCAFCGVEVNGWEAGDRAHSDHEKWSPHCDMVRGFPCGNVPIGATSTDGYDTCGPYDHIVSPYGHLIRPFSGPERGCGNLPDYLLRDLEELGVSRTTSPAHSQFASEEARLKTFVNWPDTCPVTPTQLAQAGFYYTGVDDQAICFHCEGGLKDWKVGDEPWTEHARWFSKCPFLLMHKGREFVAKANREKPAFLSAQEFEELLGEPSTSTGLGSVDVSEENQVPVDATGQDEGPVRPTQVLPADERRSRLRSVNLYKEEDRLGTFEGWPNAFMSPEDLAADGFYYTGLGDNVRCAFCGIEVHGWVPGDSAHADHEKWSPQCDFLRGLPCGNVPKPHQTTNLLRSTRGCRRMPECLLRNLEELGVSRTSGPAHSKFVTEEARLKTFVNWPDTCPVKPADLAQAGFYYTGHDDEAVCFHCSGGLKLWEAGDEPWTEHARWFSKCPFLLMHKGHEFVAKAKTEKPNKLQTLEQERSSAGPVTTGETSTPASEERPSESTLRDMELCTICYSQARGIVFLPCGHFVSCPSCASAMSNCPVCRKPCEATVRAYLS